MTIASRPPAPVARQVRRFDGHAPATGQTAATLAGRQADGAGPCRQVEEWLTRDRPKRSLTPTHKLRLLEDLAAHLAREGSASWGIGHVERWLAVNLADRNVAVDDAGPDRRTADDLMSVLKRDLRTAAFLVRGPDAADQFSFADDSLRDYFTARYLARALDDAAAAERWAMPEPSPETLDCLARIIARSDPPERDRRLAELGRVKSAYIPRTSESALAYALYAAERGLPGAAPSPAGWVLAGAKLGGCAFGSAGRPADLRSADLSGADLSGAEFVNCDLTGARFDGADLARALVLDCRLSQASLRDANLTGTVFRRCRTDGLSLDGAAAHRTQWLFCAMDPLQAPEESGHLLVQPGVKRKLP
ncbi:MAG: pentapeptide repeat-containing protein, partial [Propionibacteriaceae bacterium]|nr:pentapeptide repeat-containing protein [Propionibacteriaceae bacterium]